jgi:hypothetical protein
VHPDGWLSLPGAAWLDSQLTPDATIPPSASAGFIGQVFGIVFLLYFSIYDAGLRTGLA